jgi:hypothetical protein
MRVKIKSIIQMPCQRPENLVMVHLGPQCGPVEESEDICRELVECPLLGYETVIVQVGDDEDCRILRGYLYLFGGRICSTVDGHIAAIEDDKKWSSGAVVKGEGEAYDDAIESIVSNLYRNEKAKSVKETT